MEQDHEWILEVKEESGVLALDRTAIKVWLREARALRGLSLEKAATKLKVSVSEILRWEHDVLLDIPDKAQLEFIAKKLRVLLPWQSWDDRIAPTLDSGAIIYSSKPPVDMVLEDSRAVKQWLWSVRKYADLSRAELGGRIGVGMMTICNWEKSDKSTLPPFPIVEVIAKACGVEVPEITCPLRGGPAKLSRHTPALAATVMEEIQQAAELLVPSSWSADKGARNIKLFVDYHANGLSLDSAGKPYGLTRERVRQVLARMLDQLSFRPLPQTRFQELSERCKSLDPQTVEDAEAKLADILGGVRLKDAITYGATILGKSLCVEIDKQQDQPLVVQRGQLNWTQTAISYARRLIRRNGAALLDLVWAHLARVACVPIPRDTLVGVLRGVDGFTWLDANENWFWFGEADGSNRFISWSRRILATAGVKVDIEDIFAGIARDNRLEDTNDLVMVLPPASVLLAMLASCPDIRLVQGDDLNLVDHSKVPSVDQSSAGEIVLKGLRASGGVMSKRQLMKADVVRGVNPITLAVVLARYPLIARIDHGIYAIRGARYTEKAMAAAYEPWMTTLDVWMQEDGCVCWQMELTESAIANRSMHCPADARRIIGVGVFQVIDGDNVSVVDDGSGSGMRGGIRHLRAMGAIAGDRFQVIVDPENRTIQFEPI